MELGSLISGRGSSLDAIRATVEGGRLVARIAIGRWRRGAHALARDAVRAGRPRVFGERP
jgi:hypothetical protein